jgi:short-subunit dehydrogenase
MGWCITPLSVHNETYVFLVVTGASDGIGREFAVQLARKGFNVMLVARNRSKLEEVAALIGMFFPFCYYTQLTHRR